MLMNVSYWKQEMNSVQCVNASNSRSVRRETEDAVPFTERFSIQENQRLRAPQRDGWLAIRDHFSREGLAREVAVVLPVGCGKSGLISITPFAVQSRRTLVVAPGRKIRGQLGTDLRANSASNFFERFEVVPADAHLPETVIVESGRVNLDDIRHADIVVANIQQIAGEENRWLDSLEADFFDLILVGEAHHNPAESWQQVKRRFLAARIVNYSATPTPGDSERQPARRSPSLSPISGPVSGELQAPPTLIA
jgi:superfamily II DNA or RNA helicase